MDSAMIRLINMSITSVWMILAVVILRAVLKKAPKHINLFLWALVGVRLICPFSFESIMSIIPSAETIPSNIQYSSSPAIDTGFNAVNDIVNPVISNLTPDITASVNPVQIMLFVSFILWLIGIAAMVVYSTVSFMILRKTVKVSVRYEDNIYLCDNIKSPFILGIFKPKIYLPSDITAQQINSVIAHEKAHIKRLDHILKPLGFAILSVHWFNPFVWLAYNLFCRDIEYACDEKVIKTMKTEEKKTYSEALLSLSITKRNLAACPLAFGEVGVKNRIKSVLSYKKPALWMIIASVIALIAVATGFMTNPANSQINGKVYAPKKFYHDEVIGADRANNEETDRRYHISEDYVLSMYYDDGMNYQINHQGKLIKQEEHDAEIISLILDKLPAYYNHDKIKEVYIAENSNDLTEPKDLYVLLKYSNGALILSYLPSGSGDYYTMKVLQLKALISQTQLPSLSAVSGTKGSTDCDGVTVKIIEAVYFAENPYIKVQWENNTGDNLVYGEMFRIYRHENGKKTPVDITIDNLAWTSIAYLSTAKTGEKIFSIKYFDLSVAGIYTLEFEFNLESDKQKDYTAVLEFEIADTPSEEPMSTSDPSVQPETPTANGENMTTTVAPGENPFFNATVLEVNEKNILVEPFEGEDERRSASQIYVSTDVISTNPVPEMKKGDEIRIVYNGEIQETFPAQISEVFAIYPINE